MQTAEAMHALKNSPLNDNHKILSSSLLYTMVFQRVNISK